jgi:hypothetical protein
MKKAFILLSCLVCTTISYTAEYEAPNLDQTMISMNLHAKAMQERLTSVDFVCAPQDVTNLNILVQDMTTAKSCMLAIKPETASAFNNQPHTALGLLTTLSTLPNTLALTKAYIAQTQINQTELADAHNQMQTLEATMSPLNAILVVRAMTNPDEPGLADQFKPFKHVKDFHEFLKTLAPAEEKEAN